jgi:hypothetical protein
MLVIKNPNDMKGVKFLNDRFTLREIEENDNRYRFGFKETSRWVYIDVYRKPYWDSERMENMYKVDNGKFTNHWISAKWFSKIKNVQYTFTESLKEL